MHAKDLFDSIHTVLIIDWPSRDVPDILVRAGFRVIVKGGPGPEDYFLYELQNGEIVSRRLGRAPERADLVYSYRPLSELPQIIASAKDTHARTVWTQSGISEAGAKDPAGCWLPQDQLNSARNLIHAAGLTHIHEPYSADAARQLLTAR